MMVWVKDNIPLSVVFGIQGGISGFVVNSESEALCICNMKEDEN